MVALLRSFWRAIAAPVEHDPPGLLDPGRGSGGSSGVGRIEAVIHNAGSGVGRGVHYLLIENAPAASGVAPRAFKITTSQTRMPREGRDFALISCDRYGSAANASASFRAA
jgi:hypothetical protein